MTILWLVLLFSIPGLYFVDLVRFVFTNKRILRSKSWPLDLVVMGILYLLLSQSFGLFIELNCCFEFGPIYSPDHGSTIHFWIFAAFLILAYSNLRDRLLPPLAEILMNSVLLMAIILNVLMKPLEWFFLIVLYLFDKNPENRIALQYVERVHKLEELIQNN